MLSSLFLLKGIRRNSVWEMQLSLIAQAETIHKFWTEVPEQQGVMCLVFQAPA